MMTLNELRRSFADLEAADLDRWIDNRWIRPEGRPGAYVFHEIDVARTRLVAELRELAIDDDALPLVLSLLDQLYGVRRQMKLLYKAINAQPEEVRWALLVAVRASAPPMDGADADPERGGA
ncbi:chaperone modulator CbpM [Azospirillum brasilense]|uniref:chaperone modulator CbpM n=1 Tax=Azospirillum brasilense TaxID=192 RepID=UPI001EDC578E|nr:chaperone modulator CbpM [Azospirillum brasilense]